MENDNDKEAAIKSNKQARNHRYYVRHIEWLQEKARDRYYLAREIEEPSGEETERTPEKESESGLSYGSVVVFLGLLAVLIIVVVVLATKQEQKEGGEVEAAITPPPPTSRKYDIGGGRFIDIPINIQS